MVYERVDKVSFAAPADERYFEDYVAGSVYEFGDFTVTEADVVDFARRFDPQYIHTDPDRAKNGPFKGLIASGWHSGAILCRLMVDHYLSHVASLGSPGVDEMRWLHPVRPGDKLRIRTKITETRLSKSKPDRGLVSCEVEMINQDDQPVMSLKITNLLSKRPTA
jgi:acyl dehydratase